MVYKIGLSKLTFSSDDLYLNNELDTYVMAHTFVLVFLEAVIYLSIFSPAAESRLLSAVRKGPWHHEIVEGPHPDALVSATFNNTINQTG